MAICLNCGTELTGEDVFCPKCGAKNVIATDAVSEATAVAAAPEMTKEESIAFAEKAVTLYKNYERLKKEIDDNRSQLSKPGPDGMVKQYSAFRFFWPYLIYAAVALNVFYFFAQLSSRSYGMAMFMLLAALVVPVVLLIVGGVSARRKRDASNELAVRAVNDRRRHLDELKKETSMLETKRIKMAAELKEYEAIIPASLRNSSSMSKAIILLKSNKAETIYQAIEML